MKKKNNIKVSYIIICLLIITVIVETILLVTGAFSKVPKAENGEDILASLNDGTNYTVSMIWEETKEQYGINLLLTDIDTHILEKELSDKLSDVDSYVKNIETSLKANYVDDNGNYDEETLLSVLSNYGYSSLDDYLNQARLSYMEDLVAVDYAKTLVTDSEIKEYYDNEVYADISGVHILVRPESDSDEDLEEAKNKAQEIIDAIKADVESGTDVAEAFAKYADDDTVSYQDLGEFNYTEMDEAFSTAAYALKVNEYTTSPVKTSFGYHVILKTGEYDKVSLDDKKDEIVETLANDKVDDDSTLVVKAMDNLRTTYGLTINDSTLQEDYNRYINNSLNSSN